MYTYIIESQGVYKIGKAINVENRLSGYRTHNPFFKHIVTYEGDYEELLHKKFKDKNVRLEWFKLDEGDLSEIDKAVNEFMRSPERMPRIKSQFDQHAECPCEKRFLLAHMALAMQGVQGIDYSTVSDKRKNYSYEIWYGDTLVDACNDGRRVGRLKYVLGPERSG